MDLKGKLILVTGADGFIGSHLVEGLLAAGAKVRAFVFYNSFNSCGWLDTLDETSLKEVEVFAGDIRDPHGVRQAMGGCEFVFHLAALVGIPFSYHSPDSYVDTNIKGTLNVLQAARTLKIRKIIVTSTSEVYGTAQYVPIDERHPYQAQSPYSATKIGADRLAESFHRSFELPVTIIRPFNTFGPRQSARAIIPAIIVQLLAGNDRIRLGNLKPTRDLSYVEDAVSAFLAVMSSDASLGEEINIASGKEISIGDLAGKIIGRINPRAKIAREKARLRPRDSEVDRLLGSNEKLRRLTMWSPRFSLDAGLEKTISWFKDPANLKRYKANVFNI